LRRRVNGETQLGLAAIVNGQTLKKKRTQTRTGTTTNSVKAEETLKTGAVVRKLTNAIKHKVHNLFTNGVMSSGIVIGSIFLSGDNLLGVEQLAVCASANLVSHGGLKVDEHGTGNMLASTSLREKGVESVVTTSDGLVTRHLPIGLNAVLQAIQLPACITDLDTSLTNVN